MTETVPADKVVMSGDFDSLQTKQERGHTHILGAEQKGEVCLGVAEIFL
jgi:hypothetical protein